MNIELVPAASLVRTEICRESSFIKKVCVEADEVFVTHDVTLPGHFTMYFGVHTIRSDAYYEEDPYRGDLYVLHELWHWIHRYTDSTQDGLDWNFCRAESELQASIISECMVYFEIPELRELAFKRHKIWVDRFMHLKRQPMSAIRRHIEMDRLRARNNPYNGDRLEYQIRSYADQNMRWCDVWGENVGYGVFHDQPAFRVVERHLETPGWQGRHQEWLDSVSKDGVPFLSQAEMFYPIYKENNEKWGNKNYLR